VGRKGEGAVAAVNPTGVSLIRSANSVVSRRVRVNKRTPLISLHIHPPLTRSSGHQNRVQVLNSCRSQKYLYFFELVMKNQVSLRTNVL